MLKEATFLLNVKVGSDGLEFRYTKRKHCLSARRIEDKMDAKNLTSENVYIRMEPPPNTKKVPLLFQAWFVMTEAKENMFANCALAQDRTSESLPRGCSSHSSLGHGQTRL